MRKTLLALAAIFVFGVVSPSFAQAATVPPGNRNAEQPGVPGSSTRRTKGSNSTFDRKYQKVIDLLSSDQQLISKIKSTASRYGIDPIHMVGAIVGEHTYNVDAYDRLQSYYVKAASYAGNSFRFGYKDESIGQFMTHSQFSKCEAKRDSASLWTCREDVWDDSFRGKKVDGVSYPDNRFSSVFFQPFYAGQTFGLGQINPLTALMLSDRVARVSGFEKLDENDAAAVYTSIMDPDRSLAYMAAAIRKSIDDYKSIADMDISKNPGLTSTLYNLGGSQQRAAVLAQKNRQRAASGEAPLWPEENYYGWLVNDKLPELQKLL
ncbi:DUF1402 family protein [Agrobacterium rosae]|uniref:DUF1402 family protein n=1 Tax=Agrobacterium rosae TaxID=1972867 RepID=A0AAE5VMU7_9HYPH|nr:DUF1402 family protein [Agrobacterium rosae]KAA3510621.1 DUF1402 family protein [Agrobacterium rosae]KAA3517338.1 DUF1402 family protein [Agrobacterium rosae]MCM2434811.1 DUF1402 family protein [Agrobacterium rosae]MDX8330353.1 DUF1402 family protein [Agrobacterium rosae]MQB50092.1 DUF1402 family protein [Agrobacterium rosae]